MRQGRKVTDLLVDSWAARFIAELPVKGGLAILFNKTYVLFNNHVISQVI